MIYPFCCFRGYICDRPGSFARGLCPKHYMAESRAGQLDTYARRKLGRPTGAAPTTLSRRERFAAWCAANPGKYKEYKRKYREQKREQP